MLDILELSENIYKKSDFLSHHSSSLMVYGKLETGNYTCQYILYMVNDNQKSQELKHQPVLLL